LTVSLSSSKMEIKRGERKVYKRVLFNDQRREEDGKDY